MNCCGQQQQRQAIDIALTVNKPAVMAEVAQSTHYMGAKRTGDDGAYERIRTIDEDEAALERFWNESRVELVQGVARWVGAEGMNGDDYELTLKVSDKFNTALQPAMELALFSFYVNNIISKWCFWTDKKESVEYHAMQAAAQLAIINENALSGGYTFTRKSHPF